MKSNRKTTKKRAKLLFVTEFYDPLRSDFTGGVEARTHHIIGIMQAYFDVQVISRSRTQVAAQVNSLFSRLWFQLTSIFAGVKAKPDIVEGSNFVCYIPAFFIAKLSGAKSVMWCADVYGEKWFRYMSWPVALAGYVMEWMAMKLPYDRYIAMSNATKQKMVACGIDASLITVIYGGVDAKTIQSIRGEIFSHPTVLVVSRLVTYKRVDDVIKAVGSLQDIIHDLQLYVVGDGPEIHNLLELSNNITSKSSVHFLGTIPQQDVWNYMHRCDVFCLPSAVEGFGLVTAEAMTAGLPYVSSDIPATREITNQGIGGMLYETGNLDELITCLSDMLLDQNQRQKYAAAGLALAKQYDWRRISQRTKGVYADLI